jgi:hypothetical protein
MVFTSNGHGVGEWFLERAASVFNHLWNAIGEMGGPSNIELRNE